MINISIEEKSFDKTILNNVNLRIEQNKIYGLIGLNGTGKTTLINILLGLDSNFKGKINYFGLNKEQDVFYIPSDCYIPLYLTGDEYCSYLHKLKDKKMNNKGFNSLCELFKLDKNKLIEHYSYGMKKKIQLITAILLKCKLYVFDELTSGLDIETVLLIEKILSSREATYIISSHEIDFIERVSDEILLINNKTIESVNGDIRKKLTNLSKVEEQYDEIKDTF